MKNPHTNDMKTKLKKKKRIDDMSFFFKASTKYIHEKNTPAYPYTIPPRSNQLSYLSVCVSSKGAKVTKKTRHGEYQ